MPLWVRLVGSSGQDPSFAQEEEARIFAAEADARVLLAEATGAEQRLAEAGRGVRHATAELGGARAQGRALRTQLTRLADQVRGTQPVLSGGIGENARTRDR